MSNVNMNTDMKVAEKLITVSKWLFYLTLTVIFLFLASLYFQGILIDTFSENILKTVWVEITIITASLILLYLISAPLYILYERRNSRETDVSKGGLFALFFPSIVAIFSLLPQLLRPIMVGSTNGCSVTTYSDFLAYQAQIQQINRYFDTYPSVLNEMLLIIAVILFFTALVRFFKYQDYYSKLWFILWVFALPFILVLSYNVAYATQYSSPDSRRLTDLSQVNTGLQLYKEDHDQYPVVTQGTSSKARWEELKAYLEGDYMATLPEDKCTATNPAHQYDYKSNQQGSEYILKALLTDKSIDELPERDIDGNVFGIDCGKEEREQEFIYCIGPDNKTDQNAEKDDRAQ